MFYQFYEWNHAFLTPARALNDAVRLYYKNPLNPLAHTEIGRQIVAAGDLFERLTRRYGKPEFGLDTTEVDGERVRVEERIVWERAFCRLIHFHRHRRPGAPRQPKLVIVAPMSGHYSTLLRGTVAAMLPNHEVYITDWVDARVVPLAMGRFDLDDYIDYVCQILQHLDGEAHLVAVCQPAVPVFAATALLEARGSDCLPRSITLMGGPIDTRENPTDVNLYAASHDLDWFRRNVIHAVPYPYPGVMRRVYPGFLQLTGFMTMNLDRHLHAHYDYFDDLVKGDGDSADKHREFYDEYLSVMDLTAEFYLQTVDTVFLRQALPKGEMRHRDRLVDPKAITKTPILTIEGEKDDISGLGQTRAAHRLTPNLPEERHEHYEQAGVGHYGVFNGSRFRREIAPRITAFVNRWDAAAGTAPRRPHHTPTFAEETMSAVASLAAAGAALEAAAFDRPAPFENPLLELSERAAAMRSAPSFDGARATPAEPAEPSAAEAPTPAPPTAAAAVTEAVPFAATPIAPPEDDGAVDPADQAAPSFALPATETETAPTALLATEADGTESEEMAAALAAGAAEPGDDGDGPAEPPRQRGRKARRAHAPH